MSEEHEGLERNQGVGPNLVLDFFGVIRYNISMKNVLLDNTTGYLYFCEVGHPLATGNAHRVLLHRHIVSEHLGRPLSKDEIVHHKDGNKLNNSIDNLEVMSQAEHAKIHITKTGEHASCTKQCLNCGVDYKGVASSSYCSRVCKDKHQIKNTEITKEVLQQLIDKRISWVAIGKLFGYSDNGIKKRAKALGCRIKPL